jgi:hypothetical protein
MKKISDHVKIGSVEEMQKSLDNSLEDYESFAKVLWESHFLEEGARVFPNIIRCINRQLNILKASPDLPLEVAAGACRTVFEVYIRTKLITDQPKLIRDFFIERVFEEISILKSFKRLAHDETPSSVIGVLESRIEEIGNYISKYQLKKPEVLSSFKLAEAAELEDEYKSLYGFYSKYTHGSAWLVHAKDDERDGDGYRIIFTTQTQLYAESTVQCIREYYYKNKG